MTDTDTASANPGRGSRFGGAVSKALAAVGILGAIVLLYMTFRGPLAILEGVIGAFVIFVVGVVALVFSMLVYS
jgi:hypothetical protein